MELLWRYGVLGGFRLIRDYLLTKLFFPNARLVRFPIYIRGRRAMEFGEGLTTGVGVRLDAFEGGGGSRILRIGRNVQINDYVHIGAAEEIVIGDNTLIASRVFISDHNHGNYRSPCSESGPSTAPNDRPIISRSVKIGKNVWLGEQVCVLPGVSIGDGAVIGASSVVTRDIPERSIAVGNPARVISVYDEKAAIWQRL